MKKWLIGIAVILVLLIVGVLVAPFLIPTATYTARIEAAVENATGRTLTIAGPVRLSFLPSVAVDAGNVTLSNAPGSAQPNMLSLDSLKIKLRPLALLSGELVIDSFVLVDPTIALEIDKDGHPNWQFRPVGNQAEAKQSATPSEAPRPKQAGTSLEDVHLGDIRLVNGTLTYLDQRSGKAQKLDKIDAKLALPDLDQPMRLSGNANWNGETVTVDLNLAQPRQVIDGQQSALALNLRSSPLKLDFKGEVESAEQLKLSGDAILETPSVRKLASWTGTSLPATNGGFGPLKISGKLALTGSGNGSKASFSGAKIALDDINATGELTVDATSKVPALKGTLDIDKLDLNPYLPPAAQPGAATVVPPGHAPTPAPSAQAEAGWSDQPIDLSGLRAANVEFALNAGSILVKKLTIGKSTLALHLNDGKLAADLGQMTLYEGNGKGSLHVDGSAAEPALDANFDLAKVKAEPLLKDLMDFDRLTGVADANIAVNTHGRSEKALIGSLDGKGAFRFADGAIRGIDVGALVGDLQGALRNAASQKDQQTPFSQMAGTFTIAKGILRNDDLNLTAPALQVAGAGTVDLPQRRVDYRIEPKLAGNQVPVLVQGPWDNITYRPQLEALLKNPKALQNLKGMLGGGQAGAPPAASGGTSQKPADVLKGILGGKN